MKPHTQKFLQRRRFVMVMPMLVLPFITVIFWLLGGGQNSDPTATTSENAGLNLQLPDAHFENEQWNKLALYDKAERDSLKFNEERQNDPYFKLEALEDEPTGEGQQEPSTQTPTAKSRSNKNPKAKQKEVVDPNEAKVNQKLDELYRELNKAKEPQVSNKSEVTNSENVPDPQFSSDVQKLEQMMEMMKSGDAEDPEMQKLGGMLDKILDIQHPDRVRNKIKEQSELKKGKVFPVETSHVEENISMIKGSNGSQAIVEDSAVLLSRAFSVGARQNQFYSLDDENSQEQKAGNAIEAIIHDTQEIVAGSTVKMRLLTDVYVNGRLIPKDQFVYGTAAINGERLTIAINSIRDNNSLFPVSLSAYDLDGLQGIYIPGAITRDAAKQSSDQTMQSLQFMTMDQSLSAQAASAGLQAAKGLFSKKVKQIKVTIKAGYKIFLMDAN
ncbi:MAG: conjugative transposon protein TraM [Cyclobacteriaceae bacterium]|nr:conjugative transposon protein TraM [Cyclobacteriaceae bacterium]